jgi:hypothetical protein
VKGDVEPQKVEPGTVLFTYDVTWRPSDIHWASRWDIYLSMNNAVPSKVGVGEWMPRSGSASFHVYVLSMIFTLIYLVLPLWFPPGLFTSPQKRCTGFPSSTR